MKKWTGATTPIFYGRSILSNIVGLMPYRKPITTVVGAPIRVRCNPEPSDEEVAAVHAEYCDQLKRLFDKYKEQYGLEKEAELRFV